MSVSAGLLQHERGVYSMCAYGHCTAQERVENSCEERSLALVKGFQGPGDAEAIHPAGVIG